MRFRNYFIVSALVTFPINTVVAKRSAKIFPAENFESEDDWDGTRCRYIINPGSRQRLVDFPRELTVLFDRNNRRYRVRADSDCNLIWLDETPPDLTFQFDRVIIPL